MSAPAPIIMRSSAASFEGARRLESLATLAGLVMLLASTRDEPDADRAPLVCAACKRLSSFEMADRPRAFQLLMDALWSLDVAYRGLAIQAYARRLEPLPDEARAAAFEELRVAAMAMPPAQVPDIIGTLVRRIDSLAEPQRLGALQGLLVDLRHVLPERQPQLLWCMSRELAALPAWQRQVAFRWLLAAVRRLPPGQRRYPLVGLSWAVPDLMGCDRAPAAQELLQEATLLPVEQSRAPLAELAAVLPKIPVAGREELFERIFASAVCLPVHLRWESLSALVRSIGGLDSPEAVFDRLLDQVLQLPGGPRGDCLEGLARQLCTIPIERRRARFHVVLQAVVGLPPVAQTLLLQALQDCAIGTLPEEAQETAHAGWQALVTLLPSALRPRAAVDLAIA